MPERLEIGISCCYDIIILDVTTVDLVTEYVIG